MSTETWDRIEEIINAIDVAEDRWMEADSGLCGCEVDEAEGFNNARLEAEAEIDSFRVELKSLVSDAKEAGVEFNDEQNELIAWAFGEN